MQDIHVPTTGTVNGLAMANAVNAGFDSLQQNMGGVLSKSVAGGADVSLSAAEANNGIINLTGVLTANINVIVPASAMQWRIVNGTTGAYSLKVKTSAGTGVFLKQGTSDVLFCDGSNVASATAASTQILAATACTTTGTAPAFVATQAVATIGARIVHATMHAANAGVAATLAVNGDTAKSVKQYTSAGGKTNPTWLAGQLCTFMDDGTDWVLLNPLPSASGSYLTGQVVQVVSVTKTDTFSTSSTSMVDVTGLSAAITPRKSSNKILAILSLALNGQSTVGAHAQLVLSGVSAIGIGDAASARTRSTITSVGNAAYVSGSHTAHFLHSPGSASELTYKVQAMTGQGGTTLYVNRSQNDADSADSGRGISSLTLLEIDA